MAAGHMTSPMGSSPHRSCSSGGSSQQQQQQQQQHYSVMGSPQSQQQEAYQPVAPGDLHGCSQSQLYRNPPPSTSASAYVVVSETGPASGQASCAGLTDPLQSLQKLVMLPESRVIDPKSVVNDACLPSPPQSQDGSKNCDSSADRLGEDYSRSAECLDTADRGAFCAGGKSPRCHDGKNCSDGEQEADHCSSNTSRAGGNNACQKATDNSLERESNPKNAESVDSVTEEGDNLQCRNSEMDLGKKAGSSNISCGSGETKLVNGDISLENMESSLRNSARKHPKTRIKKLAKKMPESKNDVDDTATSSADAATSCSPDVSKGDNSDSAIQSRISNGPSSDTHPCKENENSKKKVKQNSEKSCESETNSKESCVGSDEKPVNKTKTKPLSSDRRGNESEHSCQKDSKDSPQSGWGLFLKSNEDFNDFERELSDTEDDRTPLTKPFSSSPVRLEMSAAHKLDFSHSKTKTENPFVDKTENIGEHEKCSESSDEKQLSRSKRLRSNETIENPAKKIKLSENLDAVQSLPPKKSPKGRIRKQSASDSAEIAEKEIVKESFDLEHCKLNNCFVDLSSDLTTKLGSVQALDIVNIKNVQPRRKSQHVNSSDDAVETIADDLKENNLLVCNPSSKKKPVEQEQVVSAICKKEMDSDQNINGRKIRTRRKSSNMTNVHAEIVTVDSSEDGSINQSADSDGNDAKNEDRISDTDSLTPKHHSAALVHNTKNNVARRKLSPLRFVDFSDIVKDNTKENDSKESCDSDNESDEKLGSNLDSVKVIKLEADESNDSDKDFHEGLEVHFENCQRNSPVSCNESKSEKSSNTKQSVFSRNNSVKKIHKSKSRTRTGKKDNKKHIQSFESFGLIKRTESSSQKKKKSNSVGPFIRIEGTKQFPSVVKLFNQTPVDDGDSKSNKTPKTGFVSAPTIQVSNIPSDKSVMLPLNRILSEELWLCALCGKQTSHKSLGDLFGPYYLESHLALVKAKDGGKKDPQVPSWGGGGESKTEPTRSARRRRPSAAQDVTLSPPATRPVEVWVHEDCVLWADGVFLIGSKIYGLEEAVKVASSTVSGNLGNVIFIIKIVPVTDLKVLFFILAFV